MPFAPRILLGLLVFRLTAGPDRLIAQSTADSAAIVSAIAHEMIESYRGGTKYDLPGRPLLRDSVATLGGERLMMRHDRGSAALNAMLGSVLDVMVGRPIDRIPTSDTTFAGWDALRRRTQAYAVVWWIDSAHVQADSARIFTTTATRWASTRGCSRSAIESMHIFRRVQGQWRQTGGRAVDMSYVPCEKTPGQSARSALTGSTFVARRAGA